MIKEWRSNKSERPDLVSGLELAEDEEDKMWMMLDTQERKRRKEEINIKEGIVNSKSLVECVRFNDLTSLSRMLRTDPDQLELIAAALVAAREGHNDALKQLLELGDVDSDVTDDNGWTLLRTASWSGQEQCVKVLLEAGAKVNLYDGELRTALRAACWAGHLECVKLLLEAGADIDHVDSEGRTALIAACYMGHIACVRELIIWGADIEIQDQDGRTALSVAVTCDSEAAGKLVTLLLDNGANPNKSDRDCMTPLLIAAFEGEN